MKTNYLFTFLAFTVLFVADYKARGKEYFVFDTSIRIGEVNFSHFGVVDQRREKENIGFLKKGINTKVTLYTNQPLDTLISTYVNETAEKKNEEDSLILVLYDFSIQDRPNHDELGTFHFDGVFYKGSNNAYKLLAEIDTFFEVRSNWDVTKLLLETSRSSMVDIIQSVSNLRPSNTEKTLSSDEVPNYRANLNNRFPAYHTDVFKEGIYYTLEDFVNQTPKDTPIFRSNRVIDGVITPYFYYANKKGKAGVLISDYFALTYQKETFSNDHLLISKIKLVDGNIYFKRYFKGLKRRDTQYGYLFGLAGALLIDAIDDSRSGYGTYEARLDPINKIMKPVRRIN